MVRDISWCVYLKLTCCWKKVPFSVVELLWGWVVCMMNRCCSGLPILPVMLRVGGWELVVSIVESLVVAVILPSVVQTFSIVYPNLLRKHGQWWSMSDGWGRPSVLGEIKWILSSTVEVLNWWVSPRGIYCKEDEYGRCRLYTGDYLHALHVHL